MTAILLTVLELICAVFLPIAMGMTLLRLIFGQRGLPLWAALGLAYGLGTGLLTHWMLIVAMFRWPLTLPVVSIPYSLAALAFYWAGRGKPFFRREEDPPSAPTLVTFGCGLILLYLAGYILLVFWRALDIPVYAWDAVATSTFKAKIFFYEQSIPALRNLPIPSYPLHVPFLQTWTALNLGQWDEQWIQIFFPVTFVAFLSVQYFFLKSHTSRFWALAGCALVVSSQFFTHMATVAYRDFIMLYYNCTTIFLLLLWRKKRNDGFLILAALFSGMTGFIKLEGVGYLLIHTVMAAILIVWTETAWHRRIVVMLRFTALSGGLYLIYFVYKLYADLPSAGLFAFHIDAAILERIPIVITAFGECLFIYGYWNVLWFVLLVSFLQVISRKPTVPEIYLSLALLMYFGMYFCVATFTPSYGLMIINGGNLIDLPRLILHFFPLAAVLIVLLNAGPTPSSDP